MDRMIRSIAFDPEGIVMVYVTVPHDVRENGLVLQHMLTVPPSRDYEEEIEALVTAAKTLLDDALDDFDRVPEYVPEDDEDDDDDDD